MSIEIVENEWEQYFTIPYNVTVNKKLISFQFQILHRILFTNSRLFISKILDTEMCSFCHEPNESISHLFYGCLHARKIWITIQEKLKNLCDIDVCFNEHTVIFGCNHDNPVL